MRIHASRDHGCSATRMGASLVVGCLAALAFGAAPAQAQDPTIPAPVIGPRTYKAAPCGATTVTFVPNPVNIPRGGTRKVVAQIRNKPVDNFLFNGTASARLLDADTLSDDLLDDADLSQSLQNDGAAIGSCLDVDITYTLKCKIPDEIVGRLGNSGESVAELAMEFVQFGTNVGAGVAQCVADTTAAACRLLTKTSSGITVEVEDNGSGLKSITVTLANNAIVNVPSFTEGTNNPVIVTATKVNPAQASQVQLRVEDMAGNVKFCDPVLATALASRRMTFRKLPRAERYVTIENGSPGLRSLRLVVNGRRFVIRLSPGVRRTVDVGSALRRGSRNTISVRGTGSRGASAEILIWDGRE